MNELNTGFDTFAVTFICNCDLKIAINWLEFVINWLKRFSIVKNGKNIEDLHRYIKDLERKNKLL